MDGWPFSFQSVWVWIDAYNVSCMSPANSNTGARGVKQVNAGSATHSYEASRRPAGVPQTAAPRVNFVLRAGYGLA